MLCTEQCQERHVCLTSPTNRWHTPRSSPQYRSHRAKHGTRSRKAMASCPVRAALICSTTKKHEHEHEDKYEQHQDTLKPFTMQELNDAINQLKRGKAADTRGVNAEMIKYSTRRLTEHLLRLYNKANNPSSNHHGTGETRRSKLYTRAGTWRHRRLSTHLFDTKLVQAFQPISRQPTTTRTRRQPNR